jgi:hypothetical protein
MKTGYAPPDWFEHKQGMEDNQQTQRNDAEGIYIVPSRPNWF